MDHDNFLDTEAIENNTYDYPNILQNPEQAEDQFRFIRYWSNELEKIEKHAERETEKIARWADNRIAKIRNKIHWHESGLIDFMEHQRIRKLDLAHGKVKKIKGREIIEITDPEALDRWYESLDDYKLRERLVNTKITVTPSKKALMEHYKETGECVPGVEIRRNPDKIQIDTDDHLTEVDPKPVENIDFT